MIQLAGLRIDGLGAQTFDGTTASGQPSRGSASRWEVTGPPGVSLILADVSWATGERDVRAIEVEAPPPVELGGPRPLTRLVRGGRLSVLEHGRERYVELQISRIKPDSPQMWSSTHKGQEDDFTLLIGDDWQEALLSAGAAQVGSREKVLGDDSRRRQYLCAVLETEDAVLPVVAYSLTRILPLLSIWSPVHDARDSLRNQRRVYVIELDADAHRSSSQPCVYAGETGRTPEERLATHKAGGRTASNIVFHYGRALLPQLYEHIPPIDHEDHRTAQRLSSEVERWLKGELEGMGLCVHGGTRGIDEAPFTQPDR